MIVQIVLVIVTAVQVNSQERCRSGCWCHSEFKLAMCRDLFSDVKNIPQEIFHPPITQLVVTGSTRLEVEEDLFLRWNITSLITLKLSENNIRKIWHRAFYSLAYLEVLNLSDNSITTLDSQTFYYNTRLSQLYLARNSITDIHPATFQTNINLIFLFMPENKITSLHADLFKNNVELGWVYLTDNRITDIHPSTFQHNSMLKVLEMSGNEINSIHPDTFIHNTALRELDLKGNSITDVHPSTFRNNRRLIHLGMSGNEINSIQPDTFIHNTELYWLGLEGNSITDVHPSAFYGLEHLEHLDLSNNNIQELDPLVFEAFSTSTNRQNHQVSNLKDLNLAQNKIQFFNFELNFPSSNNFYTTNPTFQLDYLNVSSNRLTTLDAASMKWLNQTTAITDLTGNPWNCDCSVLLEVWRELKHKLTLHCASPEQLQGKSWDVMEELCSQVAVDMNYKSNRSSESYNPCRECEVSDNVGDLSVLTTTLIVSGVLLVCAIGGGIILVKVVKRRRNRRKTPEN